MADAWSSIEEAGGSGLSSGPSSNVSGFQCCLRGLRCNKNGIGCRTALTDDFVDDIDELGLDRGPGRILGSIGDILFILCLDASADSGGRAVSKCDSPVASRGGSVRCSCVLSGFSSDSVEPRDGGVKNLR